MLFTPFRASSSTGCFLGLATVAIVAGADGIRDRARGLLTRSSICHDFDPTASAASPSYWRPSRLLRSRVAASAQEISE